MAAAARKSLSRLRLSPHYSRLAAFHAEEGTQLQLHLDGLDAAACEDVLQICRHLDLACEVLPSAPAPGGTEPAPRRVLVRRGGGDCPGAEDAIGEPLPGPLPAPPEADQRRRLGPAEEAEKLLATAPERLAVFHRALLDAFPGHGAPLAKLLAAHLRGAGISKRAKAAAGSSSSCGSGSGGKKKNKKKKKKAKKEKAKKDEEKKKKGKEKEKKRKKADTDSESEDLSS